MDCEVCGSPIFGKGIRVVIDGAELVVCPRCAGRATMVKTPRTVPSPTPLSKKPQEASRPRPQLQPRRKAATPAVSQEVELVDDYGQVIRKARQTMQLSQEELCRKIAEKVSVLQKIESGRLVPDDALAKKFEHALKIHLLQPASKTPPAEEKFSRPMELTLGDIAVMQKRQGEGEDTEERR